MDHCELDFYDVDCFLCIKTNNYMANQYITVNKDSFRNKTVVESYELNYKLSPRKITLNENADFKLRYVSTPEIEALLIDVHFMSSEMNIAAIKSGSVKGALSSYAGEWAFLREGELIIQINGTENIMLKAHESDSDVATQSITNASACVEWVYYMIDKEILNKICTANSVRMQLSGGRGTWELEGSDFRFMARAFWNGFYDETMYADEISHTEDVSARREAIKKKGCLIEAISFGIYIILFFALDIENDDGGVLTAIAMIFALVIPITVAILRRRMANKIQ